MSVAFIGCWLTTDGISVLQTDLLQCFINSVDYDTKQAVQQGKNYQQQTNKQTGTLLIQIMFQGLNKDSKSMCNWDKQLNASQEVNT